MEGDRYRGYGERRSKRLGRSLDREGADARGPSASAQETPRARPVVRRQSAEDAPRVRPPLKRQLAVDEITQPFSECTVGQERTEEVDLRVKLDSPPTMSRHSSRASGYPHAEATERRTGEYQSLAVDRRTHETTGYSRQVAVATRRADTLPRAATETRRSTGYGQATGRTTRRTVDAQAPLARLHGELLYSDVVAGRSRGPPRREQGVPARSRDQPIRVTRSSSRASGYFHSPSQSPCEARVQPSPGTSRFPKSDRPSRGQDHPVLQLPNIKDNATLPLKRMHYLMYDLELADMYRKYETTRKRPWSKCQGEEMLEERNERIAAGVKVIMESLMVVFDRVRAASVFRISFPDADDILELYHSCPTLTQLLHPFINWEKYPNVTGTKVQSDVGIGSSVRTNPQGCGINTLDSSSGSSMEVDVESLAHFFTFCEKFQDGAGSTRWEDGCGSVIQTNPDNGVSYELADAINRLVHHLREAAAKRLDKLELAAKESHASRSSIHSASTDTLDDAFALYQKSFHTPGVSALVNDPVNLEPEERQSYGITPTSTRNKMVRGWSDVYQQTSTRQYKQQVHPSPGNEGASTSREWQCPSRSGGHGVPPNQEVPGYIMYAPVPSSRVLYQLVPSYQGYLDTRDVAPSSSDRSQSESPSSFERLAYSYKREVPPPPREAAFEKRFRPFDSCAEFFEGAICYAAVQVANRLQPREQAEKPVSSRSRTSRRSGTPDMRSEPTAESGTYKQGHRSLPKIPAPNVDPSTRRPGISHENLRESRVSYSSSNASPSSSSEVDVEITNRGNQSTTFYSQTTSYTRTSPQYQGYDDAYQKAVSVQAQPPFRRSRTRNSEGDRSKYHRDEKLDSSGIEGAAGVFLPSTSFVTSSQTNYSDTKIDMSKMHFDNPKPFQPSEPVSPELRQSKRLDEEFIKTLNCTVDPSLLVDPLTMLYVKFLPDITVREFAALISRWLEIVKLGCNYQGNPLDTLELPSAVDPTRHEHGLAHLWLALRTKRDNNLLMVLDVFPVIYHAFDLRKAQLRLYFYRDATPAKVVPVEPVAPLLRRSRRREQSEVAEWQMRPSESTERSSDFHKRFSPDFPETSGLYVRNLAARTHTSGSDYASTSTSSGMRRTSSDLSSSLPSTLPSTPLRSFRTSRHEAATIPRTSRRTESSTLPNSPRTARRSEPPQSFQRQAEHPGPSRRPRLLPRIPGLPDPYEYSRK